MNKHYEMYAQRRTQLAELVQQQHGDKGLIVLFAAFENHHTQFRQESSFYYFTGSEEPASVLALELDKKATLYIPQTATPRAQWVADALTVDANKAEQLGFAAIEYLGKPSAGYDRTVLFAQSEYAALIDSIRATLARGGKLFTTLPKNNYHYIEQQLVIERLQRFIPELSQHVVDISPLIAQMRRKKSRHEIALMYRAVEITMIAQQAAAHVMSDGLGEALIQGSIEYVFTENHARAAFPSIVGGGKNSTVLHYNVNKDTLRKDDLVVVDIGAEYKYYCADITRTYPVSGKFTPRQRDVYSIVLETQELIASHAKPGMWLRNSEQPDMSLHHIAVKFLASHGYDKYFPHGIGHFLGMDVHDVGDVKLALQEGDVITIEPGIYIPEEKLGIRIEDDYWIVKDGAESLSLDLPKSVKEIEALAQASMHDA